MDKSQPSTTKFLNTKWVGGSKKCPKSCRRNIWMVQNRPPDWPPTKPHANGQKLTMNFRKFFISFVFISPGISYSSYKFIQHNIDNFHANELVIGISQRLCCCLQNTQEFMAYFTCFGRAFVILWTAWWMSCLGVKMEYHSKFFE